MRRPKWRSDGLGPNRRSVDRLFDRKNGARPMGTRNFAEGRARSSQRQQPDRRSESVSAGQRDHAALTKGRAFRSSAKSGKSRHCRASPIDRPPLCAMRDRNLTFNCQWDRAIAARGPCAKVYRILKGTDGRVHDCRFRQGIEERPISAHSSRNSNSALCKAVAQITGTCAKPSAKDHYLREADG